MTQILRDGVVAAALERDGYVVVPFLEPDEIEHARRVYHRHHDEQQLGKYTIPSYASGFYASTFNNDSDYRLAVSEAVCQALGAALQRHFVEYKVFYAGFLVKLPAPDGAVRVHQDPTMFDEACYAPVNIWCPLQEIDPRNGALRLLRGSHRLYRDLRAVSIPVPWRGLEGLIAERMTSIYMPAGSAVLFRHATLHASEPNRSDAPRVVTTLLLSHQSARLQTAYRDPQNPSVVDLFAQDDDYLIRSSQFSTDTMARPRIGRHVGSVPYKPASLAEADVLALSNNR